MTIEAVFARLEKPRVRGPGRWMCKCPAHRDRRASLSVRELDNGVVLLHCFAQCEVEEIVRALGLTMEDLFPPGQGPGQGRPAERKPFTAREVIEALQAELGVAWVLLTDLEAGKPPTDADRRRAGLAKARCVALMEELRLAR
ncbi:MAG: DNA primase [Rubrivivax sp.]|nr:DNA primase [Rubrivivax sp.]